MLHRPQNGEHVFEVSIYNKEVRAAVKENQSHSVYDDHWADCHPHDFVAADEGQAREMACQRYPESAGFVIQGVKRTTV